MDDTLGILPNQSRFLTGRVLSNCRDADDTTCCNSLWTCLAQCHEQGEKCISDQAQIPWPLFPKPATGLVKTIDLAIDVADALKNCESSGKSGVRDVDQCVKEDIMGSDKYNWDRMDLKGKSEDCIEECRH